MLTSKEMQQKTQQMFQLVEKNDISAVLCCIEQQDFDLHIKDINNNELLGVALLHKHWKLAMLLVEKGADPNVKVIEPGVSGFVLAINIAMKYKKWDLVGAMIKKGADPRNYEEHISPLHYFSRTGNLEMVRYILGLSAHISDITNFPKHNSPLKAAVIAGKLEVVKLLVTAGASLDQREAITPNDGSQAQHQFTPVQFAAMFGHRDIVLYLMQHPRQQPNDLHINMGLSLDLFGSRTEYSAYIDIDQIVTAMKSSRAAGRDEQQLKADLLMLQANAKYYSLTRVVPKFIGAKVEQRRNVYLELANLALNVLERAGQEPPIILPSDRPCINRIAVLQKEAFAWFCSSIATYVRNNSAVDINDSAQAWKTISYLGTIIDCNADRGYAHYLKQVRTRMGLIIDATFQEILIDIHQVRAFINASNNIEIRQQFEKTKFYQIAAFLNDVEQLEKLGNAYLLFNVDDLLSGDRSRIEATLNAIAATLEILTTHLSPIARTYFHDLDFDTLAQIRNHLRHVNGDNRQHNTFSQDSRAQRFNALINGNAPKMMKGFLNFVRNDFTEIQLRIKMYSNFLGSLKTSQDLFQQFKLKDSVLEKFKNYVRYAKNLRGVLEEKVTTPFSFEDRFEFNIRTKTKIETVKNDITIKAWNERVRKLLKLTKKNIKAIPSRQKREQISASLQQLLPIDGDDLSFSRKVICYSKYSANLNLVILCLQRIIELNDTVFKESDGVIVIKLMDVTRFNAIERNIVHLYEHAIEFINNKTFLEEYCAQNGDTSSLLAEFEQIRNYISHTANPSFASPEGKPTNQNHIFALCEELPSILEGMRRVLKTWQTIITELKNLSGVKKLQEFEHLLQKIHKKGIGKDLQTISEDEKVRFAILLFLEESSLGFKLDDNRFGRELGLGCTNVLGDGFCFFRAIAQQIVDRNLNTKRHPPLTQLPLPTTMEEILERVAVYFSEHSQELMDRIFPPPSREDFGTGDRSDELYQVALAEYHDSGERQRRLDGFRDNFYEYINLGRYDAGGQLVNAADWLPQVMSDILHIDIDIYDGHRPGAGFSTSNGHAQRIGIGRVNNNHYVSLNGDLRAAWLAENQAILRVGGNVEQQRLDLLQGKTISICPQMTQHFQLKRVLESRSLLLRPDFQFRQLVQARKVGEYLIDKIKDPTTRNATLNLLNELDIETSREVLKALNPQELNTLWEAVADLEGYEALKADLGKEREKAMQIVPYKKAFII